MIALKNVCEPTSCSILDMLTFQSCLQGEPYTLHIATIKLGRNQGMTNQYQGPCQLWVAVGTPTTAGKKSAWPRPLPGYLGADLDPGELPNWE